MKSNCADCHSDGNSEGGFDVDTLTLNYSDLANFGKWERVFDRVQRGEMPPPESGELDASERGQFLSGLEARLSDAHAARKGTVLRRLNRREYENTLNDMFGIEVELAKHLPVDQTSHEFDNIGEALGISMVHLQQYLRTAEIAMDAAVSKTIDRPVMTTVSSSYAETREGEKFIGSHWKQLNDGAVVFFQRMGYPTGMLRGTEVKPAGRYKIRITGYAYQSESPITFRIGGTSFLRGAEKRTYDYAAFQPGEPQTVEIEAYISNRYMIELDPWGIDTGAYNIRKQGVDGYNGPGLAILKVELEGPILEEFPSRGHQLLFDQFQRTALPKKNKWQKEQSFALESPQPLLACQATVQRLATIAFRRPVTSPEVEPFVSLFQQELAQSGDMESAIRTATAAILCSPEFLFLQEDPGWLDDYALATRLSYFLTRSSPDAKLRAAAAAGELSEGSQGLLRQTHRLLADVKSQRFVQDFCDAWLNLKDIEFTSPDRKLFPEFDAYLQHSMVLETQNYFKKLIDDNLTAEHLVASNFAMLNDRLADHYGLAQVNGPEIRPVALPPNSVRGGILGQGSVHKVSANGTNTSPVVRGVWVMERILASPPQPPPAGVPGVEPDIRGATTLRELLDQHRDLDQCRSCHAQIDPPGFALEIFNPIGGQRERFRSLGAGEKVQAMVAGRRVSYRLGQPVDASGELPDGTKFAGFRAFREHLAAQPRKLARGFVIKLLTFATGREMGFSDRKEIDLILDKAAANGFRVRDLLEQVVLSSIFRRK